MLRALRCFAALLVSLYLAISAPLAWAQGELPSELQALMEELASGTDYEEFSEEDLADIIELAEHPANLRTITLQRLRGYWFLQPGEPERIRYILDGHPELVTMEELSVAMGWRPSRFRLLAQLFTLEGGGTLKPFTCDLVQRAGYAIPLYRMPEAQRDRIYKNAVGSQLTLQTRFTARVHDSWAIGLKGNKRAGEPFFHSFAPVGYPYYSLYLQYDSPKVNGPTLVVGDYMAHFASGLTLASSAFSFGATAPHLWGRVGRGITGKLAYADNASLRGAAISHAPTRWVEYRLLVSAHPLTTSLANDSTLSILSYPTYTTESEAARRFNTWELLGGGNVQFSLNGWVWGLSTVGSYYSRPFAEPTGTAYRSPTMAQTSLRSGAYGHIFRDPWRAWSEVALYTPFDGRQASLAAVGGVSYAPSYSHTLALRGYYGEPSYEDRYAMLEGSRPQNRYGGHLAYQWRPRDSTRLEAQLEYYGYIDPEVSRNLPVRGLRARLLGEMAPATGLTIRLAYRYTPRQVVRSPKTLNALAIHLHQLQLRSQWDIMPALTLRGTLFYITGHPLPREESHSWAASLDCIVRTFGDALRIYARGAYANCPTQGAQPAFYENSPLYSMAIQRMYGHSARASLMAQARLPKGFTLWLKASATLLPQEARAEFSQLELWRRDVLQALVQLQYRF